jgi:hypothetical protein
MISIEVRSIELTVSISFELRKRIESGRSNSIESSLCCLCRFRSFDRTRDVRSRRCRRRRRGRLLHVKALVIATAAAATTTATTTTTTTTVAVAAAAVAAAVATAQLDGQRRGAAEAQLHRLRHATNADAEVAEDGVRDEQQSRSRSKDGAADGETVSVTAHNDGE